MRANTLVVLIAIPILGVSSTAMAHGSGGGGGGGGKGWSGGGHFGRSHFARSHFAHNQFDHRFLRNRVFLNGWGWGWGWPPYDYSGSGNTTVIAFPQAIPQAANVTGSVAGGPCNWNQQTFTVPSAASGTRPVEVVSCR
jgi:hypothetical protein